MYIFQPNRILLEKQIKKYSRYIKGKVLDVGAGEFSRYRHLFTCDEYIKMDIKKSENIDIIGSAENIPFGPESFDAIVCTQVLEHLTDPFWAAKEIHRVLKKEGYLLLTVPQTNELHEEPRDFFRYTNFGLKEIFSKAGFQIVAYDQRGGFFTLQAQLIIRYLIDKFDLYHKKWHRLVNPPFRLFSKFMMFLDKIDKSRANLKHTLGWCLILRK